MRLKDYTASEVAKALKAASELDAKICSEEWLRCYQFHEDWAEGVRMAKYDDGGGNHMYALFKGDAVVIKGFDHESDVSPYAREDESVWPGMYDGVPEDLLLLLEDPAFEKHDVTFCIWRESNSSGWGNGNVVFENNEDDGSNEMLTNIPLTPDEYEVYAREYFEDLGPITKEDILNQYQEMS